MTPTRIGLLLLFVVVAPGLAAVAAWQRVPLLGVMALMGLVSVGFLAGGLIVGDAGPVSENDVRN